MYSYKITKEGILMVPAIVCFPLHWEYMKYSRQLWWQCNGKDTDFECFYLLKYGETSAKYGEHVGHPSTGGEWRKFTNLLTKINEVPFCRSPQSMCFSYAQMNKSSSVCLCARNFVKSNGTKTASWETEPGFTVTSRTKQQFSRWKHPSSPCL